MAFICWKKDNISLCVILVRRSENIACNKAFVSGFDDIENLREDNDDMYHGGKMTQTLMMVVAMMVMKMTRMTMRRRRISTTTMRIMMRLHFLLSLILST
ncbi:LOW QUALITY PROTEIN: hypothetical protein PanWU01x14_035520 [Parasponia andersonii]|uniref:Uncharacterized protein n=1 Tax=Parasponia andersonii TaxID=3476 RepID=A0A2P5DT93_PARAD|nr:LOW QUALITY PROTEIN: hypothetical protein PanWU01x14_035520 [Parasponia andersonii]